MSALGRCAFQLLDPRCQFLHRLDQGCDELGVAQRLAAQGIVGIGEHMAGEIAYIQGGDGFGDILGDEAVMGAPSGLRFAVFEAPFAPAIADRIELCTKSSPSALGTMSVLRRRSEVSMVPVADQMADQRAPLAPRLALLSLDGRRSLASVTAPVVALTATAFTQETPSALTLMRQSLSPISPISAWPVQLDWNSRLAVSPLVALLILS